MERTMIKLNLPYFQWLCSLVDGNNRPDKSYSRLLKILSVKEFYWSVANDDNRIEDAKKLQEIFQSSDGDYVYMDTYVYRDSSDISCSVLEMLIALAHRMEDILSDSEFGDRTDKWFWELVFNLGLERFSDDAVFDSRAESRIDEILDIMIDRRYNRNGNGSLFPLRRGIRDSRKVEIWYQLMAYLEENERH